MVSGLGVLSSASSARSRSAQAETMSPVPSRRWTADVIGMAWVLAAPLAMLLPALVHGLHIGPFDTLSLRGLSTQHNISFHRFNNDDQIDTMIPWTMLSWTQVHHGQLPLWNPYNGGGVPLAFNWQSAPFGLPNLIGYLVPLQYAYTVAVVVMLWIAGAGAYLLGRVLKLGVLASAMAGTAFELSGPITGWLGYPLTTVMAYAGFLFAFALLIIAGRHRVRDITLFALAFAGAVYGGQPEAMVVLVLALAIFLVITIPLRARSTTAARPIRRPVGDLVVATVAGGALAAPLALPGLQLAGLSVRQTASGTHALPLHELAYVIFQGYDGLPITGSYPFGQSLFYQETTAYVGVIAAVLAFVAIAVRRRRPEVVALAVMTAVMTGIAYIPAVSTALDRLPGVGGVNWWRSLLAMAFGFAILAGVGLEAVVHSPTDGRVWRWTGIGFAVAGVGLALLWLFDRGHLVPPLVMLRDRSFIWPVVDVAIGLLAALALAVADRHRKKGTHAHPIAGAPPPSETDPGPTDSAPSLAVGPVAAAETAHRAWGRPVGLWVGVVLLTFETLFLVVAGAPLISSSPQGLTTTPAEALLLRTVGKSTVGFGGPGFCANLGIVPELNDAYGLHELDIYDPIVPSAYYRAWKATTGVPGGFPEFNEFCPIVATAASARIWGVSYVLEPRGAAGPVGSSLVTKVGNEDLYRIAGAAQATLTPLSSTGQPPAVGAVGRPVAVVDPNPAKWTVATSGSRPQVLRLRLTDVPGWTATIDGRPLTLHRYAGVMLQVRVPPGRHTVELTYWPETFTLGLVLAACSLIGLIIANIVTTIRRRRRPARTVPD